MEKPRSERKKRNSNYNSKRMGKVKAMPQMSHQIQNHTMPMNMQNQSIIGQEMLTRLLFQLPPDTGYVQNQMNPNVSSTNYPPFHKPIAHNGLLFSNGFHHTNTETSFPTSNGTKHGFNISGGLGDMQQNINGINAVPKRGDYFSSPLQVESRFSSQPSESSALAVSANTNRLGGAKAIKIPENEEFSTNLGIPLIDGLRKGGKPLNSLQIQKLKDATTLLQGMRTHKLQPLCLYNASELFEIMASIAETWKNSGKAAWKKRINKIKENARGRKAPRNKLDPQEIDEIKRLQELCRQREEWEKREKEKIAEQKQKERLLSEKRKSSNSFEKASKKQKQ